ncbi:hypothetical protein [Halomonas sp. CKK8]|nr:hypothetical protein [Halomonas sp. CKK8]WFM72503.1 hypothetical protein P8934_05745 [Halomonas sp. CKK8]
MIEHDATNGLTLAPDPIVVLATSVLAGLPTNKMSELHPAQ